MARFDRGGSTMDAGIPEKLYDVDILTIVWGTPGIGGVPTVAHAHDANNRDLFLVMEDYLVDDNRIVYAVHELRNNVEKVLFEKENLGFILALKKRQHLGLWISEFTVD
jgi:hypothetical protein